MWINKKFVYQVGNNKKVILWCTANRISKITLILIFLCRLLTSGYGHFHFLCLLSSRFNRSLPCPNLPWLCCCFFWFFFVRLFCGHLSLSILFLCARCLYSWCALGLFLAIRCYVCWVLASVYVRATTTYIHRSKDPANVTANSEK